MGSQRQVHLLRALRNYRGSWTCAVFYLKLLCEYFSLFLLWRFMLYRNKKAANVEVKYSLDKWIALGNLHLKCRRWLLERFSEWWDEWSIFVYVLFHRSFVWNKCEITRMKLPEVYGHPLRSLSSAAPSPLPPRNLWASLRALFSDTICLQAYFRYFGLFLRQFKCLATKA